MLSENNPGIKQVNWIAFSDNMILNRSTTYVFKIDVEHYYDQFATDHLKVLSADELSKAQRFKQAIDKKRFITGRHFIRNVLSKIYLTDAANIVLQYTQYNKPFVKDIEFNIAHSGKYVMVAISSGAVGIDIEIMDNTFDYTGIIHDIFDAGETAFIINNPDKTISFYTLWTRKEALLKATGEGLIDDLTKINCLYNIIERGQTKYVLLSFKVDNHLAALAVSTSNEIQFLNYN